MNIIMNLKELEEKGELELKDNVIFIIKEKKIKYSVENNYLYNYGGAYNDKVFRVLKIDKLKIAEKTYGYKPLNIDKPFCDRNWPEIKLDDFPALTRLVKELYLIIEERKLVYTKFTRFEIMEI